MPDKDPQYEERRKKAMRAWMDTAFDQSVSHNNIAVTLAKSHPGLSMLAESAAIMLKVFANALRSHLD